MQQMIACFVLVVATAFGGLVGAIFALLLAALSTPLWAPFVAGCPSAEDAVVACALGVGALCGAAVAVALILFSISHLENKEDAR